MKLIVGLGNPGSSYQNTRHNIGFMVLDSYLKDVKWHKKFQASYTELTVNNEKTLFVKPETYMNLSGNSIREFVNFYKIPYEDILVIQDDLDLPIGKYRIKTNSSSGGHNGIKSIIENLQSNAFARLKIGISKNTTQDTKDYVLGKFTPQELTTLEELYPIFANIINDFIQNTNIDKLMNTYNHKK